VLEVSKLVAQLVSYLVAQLVS